MIVVKHLHIEGILHDISFSVGAGERVGIIGESGSGKSVTALSIMGLSDLPAEGSITVDGTEMVGTPDRVRRRDEPVERLPTSCLLTQQRVVNDVVAVHLSHELAGDLERELACAEHPEAFAGRLVRDVVQVRRRRHESSSSGMGPASG